MKVEWRKAEVRDLADSISETHTFEKDNLIFLNTSDLLFGKLLHHTYSKVSCWPGQAKKSIRKGDILFSEIRPANGRWAYIDFDADDYVVSTKLMVIRTKKDKIHPKFLYYFLTSTKISSWLQHLAESRSGTFPQITFDQVAELTLALPPVSIQLTIVNFLDAIDGKIDLNRQTNETLEAIAQAIFQSWFVNFEPARAKAEGRVNGLPPEVSSLFPDGFEEIDGREVPRGWKVGTAEDICNKISDGSHYSPKEIEEGPRRIGTVKDMEDFDFNLNSCKKITVDNYEKLVKSDCKPKVGDVLLSKDGTMGIAHLFVGHQDLVILSSIAMFRPKKEIYSHYLYWFLKSEQFQSNLSIYSSGSVLTRLVCQDLKKVEILLPNEKILREFFYRVKKLHEQIIQNCEQSRTLAQIRNALLPRLMSGDIQVIADCQSMVKTV